MSIPKPLVSVILPLPDHREQYSQSIQSFLNQSLDKASFDVIVPSDGTNPELEAEITQNFPEARLIRQAGLNLQELYNLGVAEASGKFLYISEMHCVAEPNCIVEALAFAELESCDCVCSNSTGINHNFIAELEQQIFEMDLARSRRKAIGKVTVRGCLILRDSWIESGGFHPEFGHFAEAILGRELQAAGRRVGYADRSMVAHCNQTDFEELIASLIQYGYDECRSNHLAPRAESGFQCKEWSSYRGRKLLSAFRMFRLKSQSWCFVALVKICPPRFAWHFRAFKKLWGASIKIGRLKYLQELEQLEEAARLAGATAR